MNCKTCGMDSKTAGTCSWCGASLVSPEDAPPVVKPERTRPVVREELEELEAPEAEVEIGAVPSLHSLRTEPKPGDSPPSVSPSSSAPPASAPHVTVTSARKMAPPVPPPGKLRAPAPAVPPPSSRSASPPSSATGKLPPLSSLSDAHAPAAPARAPIASLQEQADALVTPSGAKSEVSADASSTVATTAATTAATPAMMLSPLTPPTPTLSAPPAASVQPLTSTAPLLNPSATANGLDTAIGTGVTPTKPSAPSAPGKPPITEQQKRAAVNAALAESTYSLTELLGRYLGVFTVIVIATGLLAHLQPRFYLVPMLIAMFVSAMLLPIMRVTPWVEEDGEDVALFIGLTLLFGPLVAFIIYGVIAIVRQSFNASVMGSLAVVALLRIVAEVSAGNVGSVSQLFTMTSPFASLQHVDSGILKLLFRNWSGLAALAGWYAASSFHKEDE